MRILADTSVLVAAMVDAHPAHARALPWLQRARGGDVELAVCAHTLAELYAVLDGQVSLGLSGGSVCDALAARAARQWGADRLLTLNEADFRRVWPEAGDRIAAP